MLIYNMRRVFALRGIDKPHAFLVKNGFSPATATNMLGYYPIVFKVKSLEKLCVALNCTPDDLFEWRDGKDAPLPETHALNALRKEAATHISEIIMDLPIEKMTEIKNFVEGLRAKENRPEN